MKLERSASVRPGRIVYRSDLMLTVDTAPNPRILRAMMATLT